MKPRADHRYFLPRHGLAFEAFWPRPARGSGWVRARLHGLVFGGPTPGSPEEKVNPTAFLAAVDLVEAQDVGAATRAFTGLGYRVTVHALR